MRRLALLMLPLLAACGLDTAEEARQRAERWLYLGDEMHFNAGPFCSVAIYRLTRPEARGNLFHVGDVERALWHLGQDHAVAIHLKGRSPNDFSQQLMSKDLPAGLGLLSSATGPRKCMTDEIARGVYVMLMTPDAWTIYDPTSDVLVLADFEKGVAVYLRGNV